MINLETKESREQTRRKDYWDVSWAYEADGDKTSQTKSPLVHRATCVDSTDGTPGWEDLSEKLVGVGAALSALDAYEKAVKFAYRVPTFSQGQASSTLLRYISEEEITDSKQHWDDFVIDLTDESLLCLSPSTSVGSLSESDPPLPTTPKATPPPFEHFQLNSAATPFVPRDPRFGSPEFMYSATSYSPPAKDDIGLFSSIQSFGRIPPKRHSSSKTRATIDEMRLSPSPVRSGGRLASSSSSSDLSSLSNGDTPSLVADEEGWIVMEPELHKKPDKKSPKSKNKPRKQPVQVISFPTLLPPPPGRKSEREKEAAKNKDKDDDEWIEWSGKGVSSKQQKSRHTKSRSSVSTAASLNQSHTRQGSLPMLQPPVPPPPPPQNPYYYQPSVYPVTPYMLSSPYQSFQAMLPVLPVSGPNGWVFYPTMA